MQFMHTTLFMLVMCLYYVIFMQFRNVTQKGLGACSPKREIGITLGWRIGFKGICISYMYAFWNDFQKGQLACPSKRDDSIIRALRGAFSFLIWHIMKQTQSDNVT